MPQFIFQQSFFESHAMDADNRKSVDTAEYPKHFLDIDFYPNFTNLTRDFDSLLAQYGWTVVREKGILPWATVWTLDSLTAQLSRGDWSQSYLTASDLGHYVGDAHQPLHCTMNYNGQLTGNNGIHSRYESTMITNFSGSLYVTQDSVRYIADPINFIFDYILHSQSLVDSVLQADAYAKAASGWNGQGTPPSSYYTFLWERSSVYTIDQIQRATVALASFWYTAWVDAGLIRPPLSVEGTGSVIPAEYSLDQNYPNPFNPLTNVVFHVRENGWVRLSVFDALGREIAVLVDERKEPGTYSVRWDSRQPATQGTVSSGTYFYRLSGGNTFSTKKMLLIK